MYEILLVVLHLSSCDLLSRVPVPDKNFVLKIQITRLFGYLCSLFVSVCWYMLSWEYIILNQAQCVWLTILCSESRDSLKQLFTELKFCLVTTFCAKICLPRTGQWGASSLMGTNLSLILILQKLKQGAQGAFRGKMS